MRKKKKRGRPRKKPPNLIVVHFRLSVALYTALRIACRLRGKILADVMRDLTRDFIEDFSCARPRIAVTKIIRATQLIKELVAYATVLKVPLQEQKGTDAAREQRQKKRDRLLQMGMDAFDQVYKIAQSEREAETAKCRVQAYKVLASLGKMNIAILENSTDEDLLGVMLELEDENADLEKMGVEIQARSAQETSAPQQPTGPAGKTK